MFSKSTAALFTLSALIGLSTARMSTVSRRDGPHCNTGPVQCCQNIENADGPLASQLLALVGAEVQNVNVPIGVQCNPITGIGAGSASCESEPVCCDDNNYQGLIAINCLPVNVGL